MFVPAPSDCASLQGSGRRQCCYRLQGPAQRLEAVSGDVRIQESKWADCVSKVGRREGGGGGGGGTGQLHDGGSDFVPHVGGALGPAMRILKHQQRPRTVCRLRPCAQFHRCPSVRDAEAVPGSRSGRADLRARRF